MPSPAPKLISDLIGYAAALLVAAIATIIYLWSMP